MDNKVKIKNNPNRQTRRGTINKKRLAALIVATSVTIGAGVKVTSGIISKIQNEINRAENTKQAIVSVLSRENELNNREEKEKYSEISTQMFTDNYVELINEIGTDDKKLEEILPIYEEISKKDSNGMPLTVDKIKKLEYVQNKSNEYIGVLEQAFETYNDGVLNVVKTYEENEKYNNAIKTIISSRGYIQKMYEDTLKIKIAQAVGITDPKVISKIKFDQQALSDEAIVESVSIPNNNESIKLTSQGMVSNYKKISKGIIEDVRLIGEEVNFSPSQLNINTHADIKVINKKFNAMRNLENCDIVYSSEKGLEKIEKDEKEIVTLGLEKAPEVNAKTEDEGR